MNDNSRIHERRAWTLLVSYAAVSLCFYVYFEYHFSNAGAYEDEYPFFNGLKSLIFFIIALIICTISVIARNREAIILNVTVIALILFRLFLSPIVFKSDLYIKSVFFSVFPRACPINSSAEANVTICYQYWYDGVRDTLLIDKAGKISAPYSILYKQWPSVAKLAFHAELFHGANPADSLAEKEGDCEYTDIKRVSGNVYLWSNDGCWSLVN